MATILRRWSYEYPWLYQSISGVAALSVGGEKRFRHLALQGLSLDPHSQILDLCCGEGQATQYLVQISSHCTGLDISPLALERARKLVPQAEYIEAPAEALPFAGDGFDLVHTSVALHEMDREQLDKIFSEVYRVLRLGGFFAFIDLHSPTSPLFWPPLALFMALFETQTAWELLKIDLVANLKAVGFRNCHQYLYAGGSLQVIQAQK